MIANAHVFGSLTLLDLSLLLNAEFARQSIVRRCTGTPHRLAAWSAGLFVGGLVLIGLGRLAAEPSANALLRAVGQASTLCAVLCGSSWLRYYGSIRGRSRTDAA